MYTDINKWRIEMKKIMNLFGFVLLVFLVILYVILFLGPADHITNKSILVMVFGFGTLIYSTILNK